MRNTGLLFLGFLCLMSSLGASAPMLGRVVAIEEEARSLLVEVVRFDGDSFDGGEVVSFRVGTGDLAIGYAGRGIKANAVSYNGTWHLEQIFPVTGEGAKAMRKVNADLHQATLEKSRRDYVGEGDPVPDFVMINQHGEFFHVQDLRGSAFVLNFIFTRCAVPEMCPASSQRMARMQDEAREAGLDELRFVTISFDPAFDSPGILNTYAEGYGMEDENFHLLTGSEQVVDDLLRQFGILTVEEDGTINHTMATLLVGPGGRVAFRKEGSSWTVDEFLDAARQL